MFNWYHYIPIVDYSVMLCLMQQWRCLLLSWSQWILVKRDPQQHLLILEQPFHILCGYPSRYGISYIIRFMLETRYLATVLMPCMHSFLCPAFVQLVWQEEHNRGNSWFPGKIRINSTENFRVRLVAQTGDGWRSDIAIDDVTFGECGPEVSGKTQGWYLLFTLDHSLLPVPLL